MFKLENKASLACQVRTNTRFRDEISYKELADIFKNKVIYDENKYRKYLLAFFEMCYPSLIKKFMVEQNITRNEILNIFNKLPKTYGETFDFYEAVENGKF